jgi:hypothetical protein
MRELTQLQVYKIERKRGKTHTEAINTIIDFWSNGLSSFWDEDKWIKAREIVNKNINKNKS